jgi:hypothetical protein
MKDCTNFALNGPFGGLFGYFLGAFGRMVTSHSLIASRTTELPSAWLLQALWKRLL